MSELPVVVGCDGCIFKDRLLKEHLSEDDLFQALREARVSSQQTLTRYTR